MGDCTQFLSQKGNSISPEDENYIQELLEIASSFRTFDAALDEFIVQKGYTGNLADTDAKVRFIKCKFDEAGIPIEARILKGWFQKHTQAEKRDYAIQFCFAFHLTLEETQDFFRRVYLQRNLDCHTIREAIYYYCIEMAQSGREVYLLHGELERDEVPFCPACGQKMHIHGSRITMLRHLCFGSRLSAVSFEKRRYRCPCCGHTEMESVPFKAAGHNITRELLQFTRDLLAYGFTNKEVSELTGLGKNTVKEIDLQRLKDKYTVDGKTLIKPEKQARFLGVDEFKLHNGYKYASLIIDMESGHILWLAHGKRKRSVYDFIDHVGEAWMDGVKAVACDMNSDFQEAFEERCPHIQPVFDYFYLVKNFNEKVVGAIRKGRAAKACCRREHKGRCRSKENQVYSHFVQRHPAPQGRGSR